MGMDGQSTTYRKGKWAWVGVSMPEVARALSLSLSLSLYVCAKGWEVGGYVLFGLEDKLWVGFDI